MTTSTLLSPAAKAVLDAALPHQVHRYAAAAALRAAADQVVPETNYPVETAWQVGFADRDAQLRRDILAIAAELENV